MGGCVIVSEIGSQITFIEDNLPIKKSDLLLKKPIPIFYMIVIWLEKAWLVDKSADLEDLNHTTIYSLLLHNLSVRIHDSWLLTHPTSNNDSQLLNHSTEPPFILYFPVSSQ